MATWTEKEVKEWLKKNGFDLLIKPFKEKNIDGMNLLTLTDSTIERMISGQSSNDEQNKDIIESFKFKLDELKMEHNSGVAKRIQRPNSASRAELTTSHTTTDIDTAYQRSLIITPGHPRVDMRFFRNPFFCETMKRYLAKKFHTTLSIQFKQQELNINLTGNKQDVKYGLDAMKTVFQSTEIKVYDSETICQKAFDWSQRIVSTSANDVIQQIMNNERVFTVWEKTEMFSGYYKVSYFNHDVFGASPENIIHILNHEIDYVENIQMQDEKTKSFMIEIQKFIIENRQAELAIIQHKYPDKLDIKVSLFGRKKLVKTTKKKLQLLISKHTLKNFDIKMTTLQHEHLVDNCFDQLKDLERQYSDHGVVIRIRQKEFYAPTYLIDEIKHQINAFICQTATFVMRKLGENFFLTDEDNVQLTQIVKKYGCRIETIDSQVHIQPVQIPKALTKNSVVSSATIEQSNLFLSSLSIRQLFLSNGSIEIHRANRSTCLAVSDVTVISTDAGATEECIPTTNDNRFFGTKSLRKILFKRWTFPSSSDIERMQAKEKQSIIKFIENVFEDISNQYHDARTISFSTNGWQNFSLGQQMIEDLLIQTKQSIETRRSNWRVLFLFDEDQNDLYTMFNDTMKKLQNTDYGFAQYACVCREIKITVATSKEYDLSICKCEINSYVQKHVSTTETLKNANHLVNWEQSMINVFHKYCLDRNIIVNMNLVDRQLCLTGAIEDVDKAIEKYNLLCEILKLKSLKLMKTLNNNRGYNIAFSYCQKDQSICHDLLALLLSEDYQICQPSSNGSISQSRIDRSDILLVYFSESYAQDINCMVDINYAQSLGKTIIPIAEIKDNSWLQSMNIAKLFYDIFNHEIELEFTGDFDLEYDKILSVLLCYTKPGSTGQQYEQLSTTSKINLNDTNYEESAFDHVSLALQKLTKTQHKEKEKAYNLQFNERIANEKISGDELSTLVGTLMLVVDELEAVLRGEIPDDSNYYFRKAKSNKTYLENGIKDFLICIKLWLEKAPNIIKKNIAPFTPTGNIDDAIFLVNPQATSFDWIIQVKTIWNSSIAENGYFSIPHWNSGCWFTTKQADECLQQIIKADGRKNLIYTTIDEGETVWNLHDATVESDVIGVETKAAQDMQKLKELDDPKNLCIVKKRMRCLIMTRIRRFITKMTWLTDPIRKQEYFNELLEEEQQVASTFLKQKLQNAIEFKELCES